MPPNSKSWNEYRKFVVEKLGEHSDNFGEIFDRLGKIEVDIAKLKVKAGIWGFVGGMIPIVVMIILFLIRNQLTK